ncbi:hypothetical protein BU24DRAFT_425642 [Aaosphaeria arxii CBS 175.79]|uniref:Uncharacterized protein n=1 Tax=Aaosphaeria arxii CBS 175.79 TaxID=1450172 RepID=A0A6A5XIY2_9PLEO|nr:uncharacterized protein BU24DRAFT_425642 [Aaosphaeria arxii CBS 175.79]KAF2013082.1 hypothetical protein BU24DRAFT_425642 [Aaosphaeria arxii CBS 175.79]
MAAPPEKTVRDINGSWLLNKALSGSTEKLMALQGVSWLMRKAILLAEITICIDQHGSGPDTTIILENKANFGIKATTETRKLDWVTAYHKDSIWGEVYGRSKFVSAAEVSQDATLMGLFQHFEMEVQDIVYSEAGATSGTWNSQMVWAFETISETRYFVRNTRVSKAADEEFARIVYDYLQ